MRRVRRLLFALALVLAPLAAHAAEDDPRTLSGPETSGLPLPRFVSLRATEVNLRSGPGVQYPVEWVYRRQGLPVEVIAEYRTWRKIRDWEGTQGWVHQSLLAGRRTVVVVGGVRELHAKPDPASGAIARVEPGVIAYLLNCPEGIAWCRVEAGGYEGWLRRVDFWGTLRDEVTEQRRAPRTAAK